MGIKSFIKDFFKSKPSKDEAALEQEYLREEALKRKMEAEANGVGYGINVPYVKVYDADGNIANPITRSNPYVNVNSGRRRRREMRRFMIKLIGMKR